MDSQDRKEWIKGLGLLAWISGEILGLSGAGLGLGYLLCRFLGLPLAWVVLPTAAGLALAIVRIYRAAQALDLIERKKDK